MLSFEARAASRWVRNGREKTRDQVSGATDQSVGLVGGLGASETGATRTGDTAGRRLVFGLRSGRSEPGKGLPRAMRAWTLVSDQALTTAAKSRAREQSSSEGLEIVTPATSRANLKATSRRRKACMSSAVRLTFPVTGSVAAAEASSVEGMATDAKGALERRQERLRAVLGASLGSEVAESGAGLGLGGKKNPRWEAAGFVRDRR